jgi:tetratricopeptide (TPR) repeat protein
MSRRATLFLGIALTAAATAAIAQDRTWNDLRKAATALYMKRDLDGAIALEKKALAIAEKDSPRDPRILKDLGAMGSLYSLQHRYDDAIPVYERAVALNDAGVADPRLKSTLNDLAAAYRAVGREADAKKAQARAAAL